MPTPKQIADAAARVTKARYTDKFAAHNDNGLLASQILLWAILASMTEEQRTMVLMNIMTEGDA